MEKVKLSDLTGGALQEKFDQALETVVANMQDPNTPWKNKRAITIRIAFEQNEERDDTTVSISVDTKTAPVKPIATRMAIGMDLETGEVYAQEYGSQVRGQMSFAPGPGVPPSLVIDGEAVDTASGETKEAGNVVDFRATKQA